MKIAILQNRIGIGGRNVVISRFIKTCNERGHTPTLFCLHDSKAEKLFEEGYGDELKYRIHPFKVFPIRRGTAYQTPLLHMLASSRLKDFDVVFNSGQCPYFLPSGPYYLHYIHFPVEGNFVIRKQFRSIKGFLYTLPLKLLYRGRAARVREGLFLANSRFTADTMGRIYSSLPRENIRVLYPPCTLKREEEKEARDLDFASLGSFISDKKQLEQLEVAGHLPQNTFNLIGAHKSGKYLNRCREVIRSRSLDNVILHVNAKSEEVDNLLYRSKIFFHTMRNEHFGISAVEAIDHGCLPLVHDSGGSRETVPFEELRFKTVEEAVKKARDILAHYEESKNKYLPVLKKNVENFSEENFSKEMNAFFDEALQSSR